MNGSEKMTSKPWSTSSIGIVASQFTDMRISGEVKKKLVDLLLEKLKHIVKEIEFEIQCKLFRFSIQCGNSSQ